MDNRARITLASFLAYFLMSGMLAPIGIISTPMAEALGVQVSEATALFSWLTFGILGGAVAALVVLDKLGLRAVFLGVYTAIAAALISLNGNDIQLIISVALGIIGFGCGVGLAAAALTIAQSYTPKVRASLLVVTDGAFSVAGIACAALAGYALKNNWHWAFGYACLTIVAFAIVVLAASSRYPSQNVEAERIDSQWPATVVLCVVALFLYTLGQYGILWWLPSHLDDQNVMPLTEAGTLVERFWTGMFIAQIAVAWLVLKTGARRLALVAGFGTLTGSVALWSVTNAVWLPVLALSWGIANLGFLKVTLSFATEQIPRPTSRLVSMLLLGATSGTAVSPWVTSRIAETFDTMTVLRFSSGCYAIMLGLVIAAIMMRKRD
ncbi:MAG: MFS transporter TsgA [Pseudomonadota bacterium]